MYGLGFVVLGFRGLSFMLGSGFTVGWVSMFVSVAFDMPEKLSFGWPVELACEPVVETVVCFQNDIT